MLKSLIIWASDIPGLEIEEEIIHPEDKGQVKQDPSIINWWQSFAYTVLYCVGNGAEWDSDPSITRESKRILISGKILSPAPWTPAANISISLTPNKAVGYSCIMWYEASEASPASIERAWSIYAPKADPDRIDVLIRSVSQALRNAFTDYNLQSI